VSENVIDARREGFLAACREAELPARDLFLETQPYSADAGYATATRLLGLPEAPTGFACASDVQAIGVLRAVAEAGHVIGRGIAVNGYHDVDLAEYACLTSVHLSGYEIGRQAVAQLLRELDQDLEVPEHHSVAPTLTVRASCGCTEESRLFGWPGFFAAPDDSA
jgi:LacI family transcriptional regulator